MAIRKTFFAFVALSLTAGPAFAVKEINLSKDDRGVAACVVKTLNVRANAEDNPYHYGRAINLRFKKIRHSPYPPARKSILFSNDKISYGFYDLSRKTYTSRNHISLEIVPSPSGLRVSSYLEIDRNGGPNITDVTHMSDEARADINATLGAVAECLKLHDPEVLESPPRVPLPPIKREWTASLSTAARLETR